MSELGRRLAEARADKDLSLADVEAATRIRQKYLEALEAGDYAALPRGAVARGFLRTYARHLGLEEADTLRLYSQESGDTGDRLEIPEPGKPRLVDYRPIEVELSDTRLELGWLRWVAALLVVAAIAVAVWWVLNGGDLRWNPFAAFGPAPTATQSSASTLPSTPTRAIVAEITVISAPTVTPPLVPTAVPSHAPTPTSDLLPLPIPTTQPTSTPTARPTATPEVLSHLAVVMQITQRAWVHVVVDDAPAVEDNLEAGQVRTLDAKRSITIRTGNAAGVNLTVNGKEIGAMGKIGEVVDRTWIVEGDKVTEIMGTVVPTPTATRTPTPAG